MGQIICGTLIIIFSAAIGPLFAKMILLIFDPPDKPRKY